MNNIANDSLHQHDFDHWAQLARDDPDSFESARQAAIDALIESCPAERRERMRRLQWRIDQERRLAKSPMGSCIRLSRMMWEHVLGEGGLRDRLLELSGKRVDSTPIDHPSGGARVLPFARPRE